MRQKVINYHPFNSRDDNIPNLKCIYRTPMAFGLGFIESTSIVFFVLAFSES
jgi:hypothetical protein